MDDLADGFFGSSLSAISVVNTAINMPSFVAPPLTKLCETRYARKQAEEKRKSGEEGNIVVDAFLVKIALHAFSLNLTGRGVVILLASKPLMTQSYVQ